MTYRGDMDTERRQTAKTKQEDGRPQARTFPTDCDECGKDCYCSLGCKREGCPYRP